MQEQKRLLIYLVRFFGLFCFLFYGTEAVIGLSSEGNHYNGFVAHYLNFIDPFRYFLLAASKEVVTLLGYPAQLSDSFTVRFVGGRGVTMVYSCIGYGVLSFWIAFVFANNGSWQRKAIWMLGGAAALILINIVRVSLLLIATNKGWPIPLGWDHHTWFNVVAYLLIFGMIWGYDKTGRARQNSPTAKLGQAGAALHRKPAV